MRIILIYYMKCLNISSPYSLPLLLCLCFYLCFCLCLYFSLYRVYCFTTSGYHCQYKLCRLNYWWWNFMCRVSICEDCWYRFYKLICWWWDFMCWYRPLRLICWQWFALWEISTHEGHQYKLLKFICWQWGFIWLLLTEALPLNDKSFLFLLLFNLFFCC